VHHKASLPNLRSLLNTSHVYRAHYKLWQIVLFHRSNPKLPLTLAYAKNTHFLKTTVISEKQHHEQIIETRVSPHF